MTKNPGADLVASGVPGLDDVLHGGLPSNRLYLLEGEPGSGKTTMALQFLLEGVKQGERGMYVTLSESTDELHATAASHGWTLDGIEVMELAPSSESLSSDSSYTMFHPSEVELSETTRAVLARAEELAPHRLVFDSLSEFRLLAQNPLRYRRQILALKHFFGKQNCTVIFADDRSSLESDMHLFSIAHGVFSLDRRTTEYGSLRRRLQVVKLRGRQFREGWHDVRILRGGLQVYPRLVAAEHHGDYTREPTRSGLAPLDDLLGGGLTPGTSTLIVGPAGTGKSSIAAQFASAAANRGDCAAIFLFEELLGTYLARSSGIGIDMAGLLEAKRVIIRQVDPAELSPGEFVHEVRSAVEESKAKMVIIDTLNGYLASMPSEQLLMIHLHELLGYLGQLGVTAILVTAQHGLVGTNMEAPVDTSYLADTVMLTRYFEYAGELRQTLSVVKKRTGSHERSIREMEIMSGGLVIGKPLREFRGVLTGVPDRLPVPPGEAGSA